jgi:alpha-tubulin suppressor-like RCC1 family protein
MRGMSVVAFALLAACGPRSLGWEYTLPSGLDGSAMTARVRAGGCSGTDVRYETTFTDGDTTPDGPRLPPGTYGVELEARNGACEIVGRGCTTVTLPSGDPVVRVPVAAITPEPLCPGMCVGSVCTGVDAGPRDAGANDVGSYDANVDAAPTDAYRPDAGPPEVECATSPDCPCAGDTCTAGRCVPPRPVSAIAAGTNHTCAIIGAQMHCWGTSTIGEVGGGSFSTTYAAPTRIDTRSAWTDVDALTRTTCGVESGIVRCWGSNFAGQGGTDPAAMANLFGPTAVTLAITPARVAVGAFQSFAVGTGGALAGWGSNGHNETGAPGGDTTSPVVPSTLGSDTWLDVSSGEFFTCGVRTTHALSCWGAGFNGSLGISTACFDCGPLPVTDPTPGTAGPMWTDVELGLTHACGWDVDGALYCWGRGTGESAGALGAGAPDADSPEPVRVPSLVAAAASLSLHTCVIDRSGLLWCFGPNEAGQLGTGDTMQASSPMRVAGSGWAQVSAGLHHTCAVRNEGGLFCWGDGERFVLGTGDADDRTVPTRICIP